MKTRNLIFAILWAVLAVAMVVCAVAQLYMAEYLFALVAAMAFSCDSLNAWVYFGRWLDARETLKNTEKVKGE